MDGHDRDRHIAAPNLATALHAECEDDAPGLLSEALQHGVSGAPGALPFADRIAASFGPEHDGTVRSIGAHTDAAASAASAGIGALAYATGNQVAFAGAPDLHTAAHEAAHVVQQRKGVQLLGGFGEAGDAYERHADAVADRVVSGQSAAALLGATGRAGVAAGVQRKDDGQGKPKVDAKSAQQIADIAPQVLYVMQDVLAGNQRLIADAPAAYKAAMRELFELQQGRPKGREARAQLDALETHLGPILKHAPGTDYDDVPRRFADLRSHVVSAEASDRVDNTLVVSDGRTKRAIELPDDRHPREQGEMLRAELPKLVGAIKTTLDRAHKFGEHAATEKSLGGHGEQLLKKLESALHVLDLAEGFLKLNDEEFRTELTHIKGVMNGVATYSELVKIVLEMGSAAIALTCELGGAMAKLAGDEALELTCARAGQAVSATIGKVVAGVEIVHGLATVLDSSKSADERIAGGVEVAAGVATLAAGSSLAALPIVGPYLLLKAAAYMWSEASIGYEVGIYRPVFEHMAQIAGTFARVSDEIVAAHQVGQIEKDPERKAALGAEEKHRVAHLASIVDGFLGECSTQGHGMEAADGTTSLNYWVGNHTILAEAFAGVVMMKGTAKTPAEVATLTSLTMKKITWCFEHAQAIIKGSALGKHAGDMEGMQTDIDEKSKKEK